MQTLVLNADYTPMKTIDWRDALTMTLGDAQPVYVLEYYKKSIRDSAGREYPLPCVIVLKNYIYVDLNKSTYNKVNVYYRDKCQCQYCGKVLKRAELTVDHIIPRSKWKALGNKGSSNTFENVVTACKPCNAKKKDRTPKEAGMTLRTVPKKISKRDALRNKFEMHEVPEKWKPYLEDLLNVKKTQESTA